MNIKIEIEYDGTNYAGWQKQPDKPTIQGEIEQALKKIFQKNIPVTGASRTDAGVSAQRQTANFKVLSLKFPNLTKLQSNLNAILPNDIWIRKITKVADNFNARRLAIQKIYRYKIITTPSPLQRRFAWVVSYKLNLANTRKAAKLFINHNDYALFCSAKHKNGQVKIKSISIKKSANEIMITVQGNRFLYKMVRRIVGALIEIGRGHRTEDDVKNALNGLKHRSIICAPACGLILVKVKY